MGMEFPSQEYTPEMVEAAGAKKDCAKLGTILSQGTTMTCKKL